VPLYEYRCQRCDERFEVLQRMGSSGEGVACPKCGFVGLAREASSFASGGGSAERACSPRGRFT
jgi:putative FmdB family regulatory protein